VIRREFVERVRTRAFIIGTLLGPLYFIGMVILPALLINREGAAKRIMVVDAAQGGFGTQVERALTLAKRGSGSDARPKYLPARVSAPGRARRKG
jgi:ABC-2 type transport system permease protein